MRRRAMLALIGGLPLLWGRQANAMPPIEVMTTPRGVRIWLVREPSVPVISIAWSCEIGSTSDPENREGVAALLAALLDQGAGELDAGAFKLRQDELAVRLSYSASLDRFSGTMATISARREAAFELLRLSLLQPRFDPEPLERLRRSMQVTLRRNEENQQSVAYRTIARAMFPGHPYGRPSGGTQESLAALGAEDLRLAQRRLLVRDLLDVAIVGDVSAAEAPGLIDRAFGDLPLAQAVPAVPEWVPPTLARTIVVERQNPQSTVVMMAPTIRRADPDWYAALIVDRTLGGGGLQSRLFTEIREKRGLAYGAGSSLRSMRKAGLFVATTASANERVAEAVTVAREQIARMAGEGPTEAEVDEAKTYFAGARALSLDSSGAIARALHGLQSEGLPPDHFQRQQAAIEAVTRADAVRVAGRILHPGLLTTVVVGKPAGLTSSD